MRWDVFTEIIVALLAFFGTAIGAYFANRKSTALMNYRLEKLEEEVRKHNGVIERQFNLEARTDVIEEDIKHLTENVKKLEGKRK